MALASKMTLAGEMALAGNSAWLGVDFFTSLAGHIGLFRGLQGADQALFLDRHDVNFSSFDFCFPADSDYKASTVPKFCDSNRLSDLLKRRHLATVRIEGCVHNG
jgi:hypothetical protein